MFKQTNSRRKENYLKNLFTLTYHKDVIERNKIRNKEEFASLTRILASDVGNLINPTKISNTFLSVEKSTIDKKTISEYLTYLEDAFIITKVNRIDLIGRKVIGGTYKYYFSDVGLRNARLNFNHEDYGHNLENIIYNELCYRGYSVEIGVVAMYTKNSNSITERKYYETDFIATIGSKTYYIQSAYSLYNEEKIRQEKASFLHINDSFKKIIIVRESTPIIRDSYGITTMGIIDFLLDPNSLDK